MFFLKMAHRQCKLLKKESKVDFDDASLIAFGDFSKKLIYAPIIIATD